MTDDEPSATSNFISCLLVDGTVQALMTLWLKWILGKFNFTGDVNWLLFWLGSLIVYVALYLETEMAAGRLIVFHVAAFLILTVHIWLWL